MRDLDEQAEQAAAREVFDHPALREVFLRAWKDGCEHGRWEDGDGLRQAEDAHSGLDLMGVSRTTPGGQTLTVRGRIDVLRGIV